MISRERRPKRALLGVVVNAHTGNVDALTGKRKGLMALSRCGVAGCICEHFAVADGTSYGVCNHCNHGAMYHATASMRKNNAEAAKVLLSSSSSLKQQQQSKTNDGFLSPQNNNNENENVNPSNIQIGKKSETQNQTTNNINSQNNNTNAKSRSETATPPIMASMSLAAVLSLVDNLERGAVLKTFRCEDDSSTLLPRTQRITLLNQALTLLVRATDFVSERLAVLKKEIREQLEKSNNKQTTKSDINSNNNSNISAATSEQTILQKRMDQLLQHCEKVRTMLTSVENIGGKSDSIKLSDAACAASAASSSNIVVVDGETKLTSRVLDYQGSNNNNNNNSNSNKNKNKTSEMNGMMLSSGPVEARFDDDDDHHQGEYEDNFLQHQQHQQHPSLNMASASRAASLDGQQLQGGGHWSLGGRGGGNASCTTSMGRDVTLNHQNNSATTTMMMNDVRLCRDCLETTAAQAVYCHNCGKAANSALSMQIRAPSPDPILFVQ